MNLTKQGFKTSSWNDLKRIGKSNHKKIQYRLVGKQVYLLAGEQALTLIDKWCLKVCNTIII